MEQPGRARHPVKVEVAGSNPVRPAGNGAEAPQGEVAQLAEHAAENRGVGSSILPLATAFARGDPLELPEREPADVATPARRPR